MDTESIEKKIYISEIGFQLKAAKILFDICHVKIWLDESFVT